MDAIKNWLLPILLSLAGILDIAMDFTTQFAVELNIPNKWVAAIRLTAVIVGFVILKLQLPTQKASKLLVKAGKLKK